MGKGRRERGKGRKELKHMKDVEKLISFCCLLLPEGLAMRKGRRGPLPTVLTLRLAT